MAFVVEDGTGKPDANSYASVEQADAYFSDRANTSWTGTLAQKQGALVQATDYIDARFGRYFSGTAKYTENPPQSLQWPRAHVRDEYPVNLIRACCEYALRALSAALAPDPIMGANGFPVSSETKEVGPIKKSVSYAVTPGQKPNLSQDYPAADLLLKPFLRFTSGGVYR